VLRRVDLASGAAEDWVSEVEGRPLGSVNYALADRAGAVWVSTSTQQDPAVALATGATDGFIVRVDPDGTAALVADELCFPNCMTFDADEASLYVCRSAHGDVARAPVVDGTGLGPFERYGPPLGARRDDEFGMEHLAAFGQPEVLARWGLTDGCGFDADGNLWVTVLSANRIVAITPEQEVVVVIDDPEGAIMPSPTSVAWAGDDLRDLYIGSLVADYVVTARSPVAGRARTG
jgi:gluconolactonase